jgi:hypothetical protein
MAVAAISRSGNGTAWPFHRATAPQAPPDLADLPVRSNHRHAVQETGEPLDRLPIAGADQKLRSRNNAQERPPRLQLPARRVRHASQLGRMAPAQEDYERRRINDRATVSGLRTGAAAGLSGK